jgi:hypothetical protein
MLTILLLDGEINGLASMLEMLGEMSERRS